jgi:hypothetical protein
LAVAVLAFLALLAFEWILVASTDALKARALVLDGVAAVLGLFTAIIAVRGALPTARFGVVFVSVVFVPVLVVLEIVERLGHVSIHVVFQSVRDVVVCHITLVWGRWRHAGVGRWRRGQRRIGLGCRRCRIGLGCRRCRIGLGCGRRRIRLGHPAA